MGIESRWGKRFRTSMKARYGLNSLSEAGIVYDLSVFGFFIMTPRRFPVDSVLKVQIMTPEKEHISLEGTVQWSVEKRADVKWLKKDSGMGIKIKNFMAGQEHYEKICQQLCQRKVIKDRSSKPTVSNSSSVKTGIIARLFR